MTTRGVIGDVHVLDDSAAEGDIVRFRLERVGFAEDAIFMPSDVDTVVQADGTIERRELWASAEGGRNLLCILPNGHTWRFSLQPGATDITLQELHALNTAVEPAISPTIQTMIDAAIELDFAAERARYASTIDGMIGASHIGYKNAVAGAVASTVYDKLNEWTSGLDLGLHGDGEPESVEALGKLIDFPSNKTLILKDGAYDCSEMPQVERIGDLYLRGSSMGTVDLIGAADRAFLYTSDSVIMRDLTLSNWGACLSPANTRSRDTIDLERVRMRDSTFGVITASLAFNPNVIVDRFRAINCVFERCGHAVPGAGAILFWIAFNNAYAHGNYFDGNVCRAVQFGRNLSMASGLTSEQILAYQELFANSHVTDNSFNNQSNGIHEQTTHTSIIYGKNGIVMGNSYRRIISTAATLECTAIYTKCRQHIVAVNTIDDLYHSAGEGGDFPINIKGSPRNPAPVSIQGYGGVVFGNLIKLYGRGKIGIRFQQENTKGFFNIIDSPKVYGMYVSSGINDTEQDPDNRGYDDLFLGFNEVHGDPTLSDVIAINATSIGDRGKIVHNTGTDVAEVVRVNPQQLTPKDYIVDNNVGVRAKTVVRLSNAVPMENVDITNNHGRDMSPATGNASAVLVDGVGGGRNLRLQGNTNADINPLDGTAVAVDFKPGGFWDNVTIKDNPGDAIGMPVPPMLTAVLTGDAVTSVTVQLGGHHIRTQPTLVFTRATGETAGSGAAGTPVIGANGELLSVTMTNGGSGYLKPPIVTMVGGNIVANAGYHTRIGGVEAGTMYLDPGMATQVATRRLQIDTPPRNRQGPIYDDTNRWNPPLCVAGGTQTTTVSVAGVKAGAKVADVTFVEDSPAGNNTIDMQFTAKVMVDGVVTVRMENKSGIDRNLNLGTVRLWMENP